MGVVQQGIPWKRPERESSPVSMQCVLEQGPRNRLVEKKSALKTSEQRFGKNASVRET